MYGDGITVWKLKGTNKWVCQVRVQLTNGEYVRKQKRANSRREAQQAARDLQLSAARNLRKHAQLNLELVVAEYQEHKKHQVRSGTLGNYVQILNHYVLPTFGKRKPETLTSHELGTWMNGLRERGLRHLTVNTIRARFLDVLKFAVRNNYISKNPMSNVEPQKNSGEQPGQKQPNWSLEEARRALAVFSETPLDLFVSIALSTGMRKGEILALQWGDFDLSQGTIRVNKSRGEKRVLDESGQLRVINMVTPTKTSSSNRALPLNEVVQASIARLRKKGLELAADSYVVSVDGVSPMSISTVRRLFERTCQESGLRRLRIHDIRHTVAVLSLEQGTKLEAVSQGLGHSGVEITKRIYAPVVPALIDSFSSILSDALTDN